eukprot:302141-Rhodomonas_salina.2
MPASFSPGAAHVSTQSTDRNPEDSAAPICPKGSFRRSSRGQRKGEDEAKGAKIKPRKTDLYH